MSTWVQLVSGVLLPYTSMATKARALGKPDAAALVARRCMEIAR